MAGKRLNNVNAANKVTLDFVVDLGLIAVPTGSTANATGYDLTNGGTLFQYFPNASEVIVHNVAIKAKSAIAGATSVTSLSVFLRERSVNSGNNFNVNVQATSTASLTVTAGAVADGVKSISIATPTGGLAVPTGSENVFVQMGGVTVENPKVILAAAGAATVPGTASGTVEVFVTVEPIYKN